MSNQRDAVSQMVFFDDLADITVATASPTVVKSAAVDTKDLSGVGFVVKGNRVLVAGAGDDLIYFTFEESDTLSGTYTAVPAEGSLPSRKAPDDNNLVVVVVGKLQPVGVFGTKRFVKLVVTGQPATSDYVITPRPYGIAMLQEDTSYDPATVPSDGKP